MKYNNPKEALSVVSDVTELNGSKLLKVTGDCSLRVSGALDYLKNYCGYTILYPVK